MAEVDMIGSLQYFYMGLVRSFIANLSHTAFNMQRKPVPHGRFVRTE
jgi:hypothetical protein